LETGAISTASPASIPRLGEFSSLVEERPADSGLF
jgi:hypothetical protein